MKNNSTCLIILIAFFVSSCVDQPKLDKVLESAGSNRKELLKVINHYRNKDNADSLKLKAAHFLIENMSNHSSIWNASIDSFRNEVIKSDSLLEKEQINTLWAKYDAHNKPLIKKDLESLGADFLIHNIDIAFKAWKQAPWTADVDFDSFCRYILPYRFRQELLADGWRDTLYNTYQPLIKNAKTEKEAFEIIYDIVGKQFISESSKFPYIIDVIAMQHQKAFSCMQRSVLIGSVMRALGIPVTIDYVGGWANYSNNGHAWVSLVTKEGTFSIYEDETEAKMYNRIDATRFELNHDIAEDYPFLMLFQKRYSKVYRYAYERNSKSLEQIGVAKSIKHMHEIVDVSKEYGLDGKIDIKPNKAVEYVCLCTFAAGMDWMPICYSKVENGTASFNYMGDSVLYLPIGFIKEEATPVGMPFILVSGKKQEICPNTQKTSTIEINRKYPLTGKWLNEWSNMIGNHFEASNNTDFSEKKTLCTINDAPVFINSIKVDKNQSFRYVRYVSECTTPMAEVMIIGENGRVNLTIGNSTINHAERTIDNDTKERANAEVGYIVYDLGIPHKITSIIYVPKNDDNFVVPNHEYELFYYNDGWTSLGKQMSKGYSLRYDNVPDGALLLLRDKSKGKEERPFLYKDGKQEWW